MARPPISADALVVADGRTPRLIDRLTLPAVREVSTRPRLTDAVFRFNRWGNVFTPENSFDPYLTHDRIRADGPVCWNGGFQQWFVTGYDEVVEILTSSAATVRGQTELVLACRPHSKMSPPVRGLMRKFLLFVDPPDHTRLRRLVSRAFSPRQVARLEAASERQAALLLDEIADNPTPEMFAAFNAPFPIRVISELLGIPEDLWPWSQRLSDGLTAFLNPFPDFDRDEIDALLVEGINTFDDLIEERRASPTDDLISALVTAEDDGDRLDRYETIATLMFLMFAGHETTSGVLGNAIVGLARFPDQRELIRNQPELWPNAVEEFLRWDTALQIDPRQAAADIEVGGQRIRQGQNILLMLGAANRDPRRYQAPDELRLDRSEPRPISFGHGPHYCLGAALARMELRVGLKLVVERFGDFTVELGEVEMKEHMVLRGPVRLPIRR